MKKKIIIISIIVFSVIFLVVGGLFLYRWYQQYRIDNAEIIVELSNNLNIDVYSDVKLSDLIISINGELVDDFIINTNKVGTKHIEFKYVNDDDILVSYDFDVNVVDTVAPLIFSSKSFSVTKGYTGDLASELFCGDNYDDDPKCELVGYYDYNIVGTYPISFVGTDSSGNVSTNNFNLIVKNKSNSSSSGGSGLSSNYQNFSDIV